MESVGYCTGVRLEWSGVSHWGFFRTEQLVAVGKRVRMKWSLLFGYGDWYLLVLISDPEMCS